MKNHNLKKQILLAMFVAIGVVISPILRIEGYCPMQHFINVTSAVILGPGYAVAGAILIALIRMTLMGVPPLALTGAVFGAGLSGLLYRLSRDRLVFAVIGEVIGTGIIGAIVSYPVMAWLLGRNGLTWLFYVPSFLAASSMGGCIAFLFLKALKKTRLPLFPFQPEKRSKNISVSGGDRHDA